MNDEPTSASDPIEPPRSVEDLAAELAELQAQEAALKVSIANLRSATERRRRNLWRASSIGSTAVRESWVVHDAELEQCRTSAPEEERIFWSVLVLQADGWRRLPDGWHAPPDALAGDGEGDAVAVCPRCGAAAPPR